MASHRHALLTRAEPAATPASRTFYYLARDVHLADVGRQTIFLDLRTDKYQGVDSAAFWSLAAHFGGIANDDAAQDPALLHALADKGLLTTRADEGQLIRQVLPVRATRQVSREYSLHAPRRLALLASLLRTARRSDHLLRTRPLQHCVEMIRIAKAVCAQTTSDLPPWLSYALHARFYYPADAICLRDSFLLMNFLVARGVSADWVFGVKTDPFEAHCWVQIGDVVLNDDCDRTLRFHPILVV